MLRTSMLVLPKDFHLGQMPCLLSSSTGHRFTLRSLKKSDGAKLYKFFQSHSPETLRQRYAYNSVELSLNHALKIVEADQEKHTALAIFEKVGRGSLIVALATFSLNPEGTSAEMAFVVHEERRRIGMASVLLGALLCLARERKLKALTAQTLSNNFAMLSIFIKHGGEANEIVGTDGMEVVLPLT